MSSTYAHTNGGAGGSGFGNSSSRSGISPSPSQPQSHLVDADHPHPHHHHPQGHDAHMENGYHTAFDAHNEKIISHISEIGFRGGNYSDMVVHVAQNQYRLHSLILSRSPYLAHLMSTTSTPNIIHIPLQTEPHVTEEGVYIALGWLYSYHVIKDVQPRNARSVLAAGCLLGGMPDLCDHAYQVCRTSLGIETVDEWLEFTETIPVDETASEANGSMSTIFGPYAPLLRQDVFDFLVVELPSQLDAFSSQQPSHSGRPSGHDTLLDIYSRVPFDIFRRAVESPAFPAGSDQNRFRFAKSAIALRRNTPAGRDAEETVVLAFGGTGDSTSAVHITRKMKAKKKLWKVAK